VSDFSLVSNEWWKAIQQSKIVFIGEIHTSDKLSKQQKCIQLSTIYDKCSWCEHHI